MTYFKGNLKSWAVEVSKINTFKKARKLGEYYNFGNDWLLYQIATDPNSDEQFYIVADHDYNFKTFKRSWRGVPTLYEYQTHKFKKDMANKWLQFIKKNQT